MANKHDAHADFILERTLAGDPRAKIARDLAERGLETTGSQLYTWLKKRQARIQKNAPLADPLRFMPASGPAPVSGISAVGKAKSEPALNPGAETADKASATPAAAAPAKRNSLPPQLSSKAGVVGMFENQALAEMLKSQIGEVASTNPFLKKSAHKGKPE